MNREENVKMVSEMMDLASKKVPELITKLLQAVYSPEAARQFGQAVGAFYGGLVESGIPADRALSMAEDYARSLRDMVSKANLGKIEHSQGGPEKAEGEESQPSEG